MTDKGPRRPRREPEEFDYEALFEPDPPQPPLLERIDKPKVIKIAAVVLAVIFVLAIGNFVLRQFNPAGSPGGELIVQIPEGSGGNAISSLLADKDVIPSAWAFKVYDKLDRKTVAFQAGEYTFKSNMGPGEAMRVLAAGPKTVQTRILIPEGFTLNQIAERVGTIRGLSRERFLQAAEGGSVRSYYQPEGTTSLEGFLFPDTYLLTGNETEVMLLSQMVARFDDVASRSGIDNSLSKISQTPYDTLKIASMIEAEARTAGDRGKISRVIENRLYDAMNLQIDATVAYGLNKPGQALSTRELQADSAWNTYTRAGLPETPICNPGQASIEAALNPVPGDWLFYVLSDAQGNHAFATTFAEHEANIAAARAKGLL